MFYHGNPVIAAPNMVFFLHMILMDSATNHAMCFARALVSQPEIVFADEPSGNLDSKASGELLSFMRRAVKEFGQTIVMVTHDPVVASYADRIVFLDDGQIVDEMLEPTSDAVLDRMKSFGA